ncbi:putative AC transposase [Bienertia sinuspersici]
MARDILAIPLSMVASKFAFSVGSLHLDPFRSSLTRKMVQALICTQYWLRANRVLEIDMKEILRELEEVEKDFQATTLEEEDVVYVDSLICFLKLDGASKIFMLNNHC